MEKVFRSSCLIASALDLIGDRWTLLVVRDMLMFQKKTFKELAACDERVASNLLSGRLKLLESLDLLTKRKLPGNRKENVYLLTERGMDLAPIILELALWSDKHARDFNPDMNENVSGSGDKDQVVEHVKQEYRAFVSRTID